MYKHIKVGRKGFWARTSAVSLYILPCMLINCLWVLWAICEYHREHRLR